MRLPVPLAVLVAAALLVAGCQSTAPSTKKTEAKPAPQRSPSFQAGPAVRCDRTQKLCSYQGVASVGLTRLYFGDGAARRLTQPPAPAVEGQPAPPPPPPVADPIFKPSPWQSCDTLVATCYEESGASTSLTAAQFGSPAGKRLDARRRKTIVRYGSYITCDKLSKVCYDRLGAGVGVTRLYLGEAESDRLLERLRKSEMGV